MSDYHEAMNPYSGNCKIHGGWEGSYDECPTCMEADYQVEMAHEFDWVPKLCGGCGRFSVDDDRCGKYGTMPSRFFGRKEKCKHFKVWVHQPERWDY